MSPCHISPGGDLAGVVEAVGAGAEGTFAVGDRVFGLAPFVVGRSTSTAGSCAEFLAVKAKFLAQQPESRPFAMHELAAVPLVGLTALHAFQGCVSDESYFNRESALSPFPRHPPALSLLG